MFSGVENLMVRDATGRELGRGRASGEYSTKPIPDGSLLALSMNVTDDLVFLIGFNGLVSIVGALRSTVQSATAAMLATPPGSENRTLSWWCPARSDLSTTD